MRIRQTSGHIVYSPLSYIFQIVEVGGSYIQKFDTLTGTFAPNREITPFVMLPQLIISDPDGKMPTGDYSAQLVNVSWKLTISTETKVPVVLTSGYTVDNVTNKLTISRNIEPAEVLHVTFTADYLDKRRNEVQHFEWERDIVTEAQTNFNVTLDTGRWKSKILLQPFKNWGQFAIPVQLKYGDNDVLDADATYQWQWWDKAGKVWVNDFTDQPWYVSGATSKQIMVEQEYIQDVLLRCKAYAFGVEDTTQYFCTRLRRWYGQYDYDVEFLTGKYIFHDTQMVVLSAWVANYRGNIKGLSTYFDIELFFAVGDEDFESVGYGEEAIIKRSDLLEGEPRAGVLCRELSAYVALADNSGSILTDNDGKPLFAQFPTTSREI